MGLTVNVGEGNALFLRVLDYVKSYPGTVSVDAGSRRITFENTETSSIGDFYLPETRWNKYVAALGAEASGNEEQWLLTCITDNMQEAIAGARRHAIMTLSDDERPRFVFERWLE
ncbi:MAG: hypothetical protein EPO52_10510 [Herbiconiux sp.]|uniref:hypothetical protein n=1 Tax=Herbiconiux sp. TaxID=1871186 RepID=UPI0012095345|nr:hypothetical protein [Herbiconiux sp.]TAJ48545.1 MAG: hypothetical protein EPO52_10510 [Herbiconiux sp.]